ncbi:hypothetical protein [Bradyrhizobium sp. NBAIM08]|uniref:5-methylcytosine restriction system specificity protein McrC n=1 Tax=Bradyrhizobium sp. NBAIM08 TaxID=2793815 RepID=UPI001CD6B7FF|nr:hypothetical protein [Bradyrhizobium sp. NBAIM08]MCA1474304.1 hypothetical protein [Bradyrhizobium sp. NBAIM08]
MPAIPIQNIYYLLCYAWDALDQGALVDVSKVPSTKLVDLFAHVLLSGLRHLVRMGLEQGYQETSEEISGLRGRLNTAASLRRASFIAGRAHCTYDEVTANTLANRIIKTTLVNLERHSELDSRLRDQAHGVIRQLPDVATLHLSNNVFKSVSVTSNRRFYRFLLNVCELINDSSLVEPTGSLKFRDFTRDDKKMWRLFQSFLQNFIRRECKQWAIKSEEITWQATGGAHGRLNLLPRMVTDISVWRPGEYRIIDAKFYSETLSRNFGVPKLHSDNLYQMLAYVMNAQQRSGVQPEGVIIYPKVGEGLREEYHILGRKISICTLDLSAPWRTVDREMRELFR